MFKILHGILTIVRDQFDYYYYINGNLVEQSIIENQEHFGLASMRFGNIGCCADNEYLHGKIDDFTLWNRSFTSTEVSNLFYLNEGCLDETAFNYSPEANSDDGSCIPVIEGCLDEIAF